MWQTRSGLHGIKTLTTSYVADFMDLGVAIRTTSRGGLPGVTNVTRSIIIKAGNEHLGL